jgi:tetratricopeptide (TPR) repeat protein
MLDLRTLGLALMWNGLWEDAYPVFQNALSLAQDLGNRYETAFISLCLGLATHFTAQYELSREHHVRALELARCDNFQREIACSLFSLGCITVVQKTPQEARPFFHESIAVYRQIGDLDEMGWSLSLDAYCCLENGDSQLARQSLVEALEIAHSRHAYFTSVSVLPVGAIWLERHGELEKALETFTSAFQQPMLASSNWFHEMYDKFIAACVAGLPAEVAAAARERGQGRQLFEAVDELAQMITASS